MFLYFFKKLLGHFCKKKFFAPQKNQNTCKKVLGQPPIFHFSPKIFFCQNDSEWLGMDFKHNFSQCNILTNLDHFLKASLMQNSKNCSSYPRCCWPYPFSTAWQCQTVLGLRYTIYIHLTIWVPVTFLGGPPDVVHLMI